jgi:hypothetical protein
MGISDDKTGIVACTSGAVLMRTKLGSVRTSIGHNSTHIWDTVNHPDIGQLSKLPSNRPVMVCHRGNKILGSSAD